MSDPIVEIRGTVTTASIVTDPEGKKKPSIKIELLQITKAGSNITHIKDENLNNKYIPGSNISVQCRSSVWQFNNKVGVTYKVFSGGFEDICLGFGSGSDSVTGSSSNIKKTDSVLR